MRILITRPEPEATSLARDLDHLGHEGVVQPLLEFEALSFDDSALLKEAAGLIMTSGSVLRALKKAPRETLPPLLTLPLYCVGEATADKARAFGFISIAAIAPTARDLADALLRLRPPSPLLHLCGEHKAFDMSKTLTSSGIAVRSLPVYTMRPRHRFDDNLIADLHADSIDGVLLMSPRTAEVFHSLCVIHRIEGALQKITFFCLSHAIATKLTPFKPERVRIAKEPTRQALLDLVKAETGCDGFSARA